MILVKSYKVSPLFAFCFKKCIIFNNNNIIYRGFGSIQHRMARRVKCYQLVLLETG